MSDTAYQSAQQSVSAPVQSAENAVTTAGYTQASGNTAVQDSLGLSSGTPTVPPDLDSYVRENPQDSELVLGAAGPEVAIPVALRNDDVPEVDAWLATQSDDTVLTYGGDACNEKLQERMPVGYELALSGSAVAGIAGIAELNPEVAGGMDEDGLYFRVRFTGSAKAAAGIGVEAISAGGELQAGGMADASAGGTFTFTLVWRHGRAVEDIWTMGAAIARGILTGDLVTELEAALQVVTQEPPVEVRQEVAVGVSADAGAGAVGAGGGFTMGESASAGAFAAYGYTKDGESYSEIGIRTESDVAMYAGELNVLGVTSIVTSAMPELLNESESASLVIRAHAPVVDTVMALDPTLASFTVTVTRGDWSQVVEAATLAELPGTLEALLGDLPGVGEEGGCAPIAAEDVPDRSWTTSIHRDGLRLDAVEALLTEGQLLGWDLGRSRGMVDLETEVTLDASAEVPSIAVQDVVMSEEVWTEGETVGAVCTSIADGIGQAALSGERAEVMDNPNLDLTGYAEEAILGSATLTVAEHGAVGGGAKVGDGVVAEAELSAAGVATQTVNLAGVPLDTIRGLAAA